MGYQRRVHGDQNSGRRRRNPPPPHTQAVMRVAFLVVLLASTAVANLLIDDSISIDENDQVVTEIANNSPYHVVGRSEVDGSGYEGTITLETMDAGGDSDGRLILVGSDNLGSSEDKPTDVFTLGRMPDSDQYVIVGAWEDELTDNFGVASCDTHTLEDNTVAAHHCNTLNRMPDGTERSVQHLASVTETDYDDSLNSLGLLSDDHLLTDMTISTEENNSILSEIASQTYKYIGDGPEGEYEGSATFELSTPGGTDDGRQVLIGK